jgi:hypothetical protein
MAARHLRKGMLLDRGSVWVEVIWERESSINLIKLRKLMKLREGRGQRPCCERPGSAPELQNNLVEYSVMFFTATPTVH